jgi:hypothetical protein
MTVHPFEKAGLGKAPFKCVAVTVNVYDSGAGSLFGSYKQPGGSCDYCGTGIMYEYWITGADGSKFKVGSDCVAKTGGHQHVSEFKAIKAKHMAEKRSAKRKEKWEARQAQWAAEAATKRATFDSEHPGLYEAMKARGEKSVFFKDLAYNVERWGALTPNQLTAVQRIMNEDLAKARLDAHSQFVGTVGKAYTGKWTVLRQMSWPSQFWGQPPTHLHVLSDGESLFVYKGSRYLGPKGTAVQGTFTVKEHSVYEGVNQTVLARPRKDLVTAPQEAAA